MFDWVLSTSLNILAFRLNYLLTCGTCSDCDAVERRNESTREYMGVTKVSCLFKDAPFSI